MKSITMLAIIFLTFVLTSFRVQLFDEKTMEEVKKLSAKDLENIPDYMLDEILERAERNMKVMLNISIFGLLFLLFLVAKFF